MTAYLRPDTIDEALAWLAETRATVAAGCTDLFPATEARALAGPVLDITGIAALRGIAPGETGLRIGGATTWSEVIRADLPPAFDMLKAAAREVGSVQIQNAGTLAGNLCNASPAADGVPCLLALDAEVELASVRGARRIPLSAFLTGVRRTARAADEIVTALHIPKRAQRGESAFMKLGARKYLVISIAMVAVRVVVSDGRIAEAALAVGACSPVATRLPQVEAALAGLPLAEAPGHIDEAGLAAALAPITDIRAEAAYRPDAAAELLRRALAALAGRERTEAA